MIVRAILAMACAAAAQTAGEVRVIIQADDLGAGHGINVAAIEAYKKGVVRTANVLMPSGWVPEAARLLNENPGLEAGVHLTLTSEWATVKWRPLTLAPGLSDAHGYLFPQVRARAAAPGTSVEEAKPTAAEVEKELTAQILLAKKMIPLVSYATSHMGFSTLTPEIDAIVRKVTAAHGLIFANRESGMQSMGRVWERADSGEVRAEKLAAKLASLGPGLWIQVEHPATDTPEMQSFAPYVAADRSAVLAAWTHPKVLDVVAKRGIRLTNHRESAARKK